LEAEGPVITEDIPVVVVATNDGEKDPRRPLVKFWVPHEHNMLGVSKSVIRATLWNKVHGKSLTEFLLSRPEKLPRTNEFLDLAKSNDQLGKNSFFALYLKPLFLVTRLQ
jgi:hypothetical protein